MSKIITDVDVSNQALGYLGEQSITSLTENTKEARQANLHFEQTLREIMESRRWACGRKRQRLSRSGTDPAFGWEFAHQIPNDCVRILDVVQLAETPPTLTPIPVRSFEKEDGEILSNVEHCGLIYVREVDSSDLPPLLVKGLAMMLASKMAIPLGETRLAGGLSDMAENAIQDAWMSEVRQDRSGENSDFLAQSSENASEGGRF